MAIEDNNADLELAINYNSDVLDKTSNNRDGTITGMTFDTTTPIIGSGTGVFRGGDDYVSIDVSGGKSGILDLTTGTVWFTFRLPTLTTLVRLFSTAESGLSFPNSDEWVVQFRGDASKQIQVVCIRAGIVVLNALTPNNTVTTTGKHSVAVRADGVGNIEVKVDDVDLTLSGTLTADFFGGATNADNMTIGAIAENPILPEGEKDIDTTYVWNTAISDADLTDLENGGAYKELLEALDTTTVGVATAVASGTTTIDISMPYTDDGNTDNTYTVDYKLSSDTTYTNFVTGDTNTPSPYTNTITGLLNGRTYDVKMTYIDPDGITGTNPQTITGINLTWIKTGFVPKVTRQNNPFKVVKNDSILKVVKRSHIPKIVK